MNSRKTFFACEIMANMIKVGSITYDVDSMIDKYGQYTGLIEGRVGNYTHKAYYMIKEGFPKFLEKYGEKELDELSIWIRNSQDPEYDAFYGEFLDDVDNIKITNLFRGYNIKQVNNSTCRDMEQYFTRMLFLH